ncbi:DUF732 domain-containing protein [Mycolicibacter longobardus]|uniref:DUF732 domain-containing protein n=1 Tax=Mycolicibacter longobardus TaxID=1108812 RepID=A0A1X1YB35_9MYCO|nr:DUF732 domain-containing protein [Mycolicibacter longobardus]MCV7385354.1 DUF732 domain-containing protein [Mycolicibacter longobardus]ORW08313.1 hypothetical protein AWC16_19655 [Mycolicibacter longobardus]
MKHSRWITPAISAAALVSLAAPAHADTDADATFLSAVDKAGIEYTDPQDAVAVGHQVCDYLYAGHGPDSAARALKISNRSISAKNAARFVAFAETAYCPEKMAG